VPQVKKEIGGGVGVEAAAPAASRKEPVLQQQAPPAEQSFLKSFRKM
jgi:hypothetical protein